MSGDIVDARPIAAPAGATPIVCPKCKNACTGAQRACPRCGLMVSWFVRFAAEQANGKVPDPEALDTIWDACCARWDEPRAHDLLLDQASTLECLPALARRYRERLEKGADPVAERRLNQITVLLVHAVRAQAHDVASTRSIRLMWAAGYCVAAAVMAASAWMFFLVLRRHG